MKTLVQDYIFDKTNKRVIFTGIIPSSLEELLLITNVSTGDIIYNFADKLRGGTLQGNVLTVMFDTSKMSDTDHLQIFIDSDSYHQATMRMLASIYKTMNYSRDSADRMRVIVDNNPTTTTTATLNNRSSAVALGASTESWYSTQSWNTVDAREQLMEQSKNTVIGRMQRWVRS